MEKFFGLVLGLGLGVGFMLGVDWVLWKAWNWAIPGIFHWGYIDNYWMFVIFMLILAVVGGYFKSGTSKA